MLELESRLQKKNNFLRKLTPNFANRQMDKFTAFLKKEGYEKRAHNIGDTIPEDILLNHKGQEVSLEKLLDHKPAIINFYRGTWCPYCNLELRAYIEILKEEKDVIMFSISPESPDVSEKKYDLEDLNFTVLTDADNHFAKKLNLVFKLPGILIFIYRLFGINLNKSQKNKENELPIPATYVIDSRRVITYAWLNADYTKRVEPSVVLDEYRKLLKK